MKTTAVPSASLQWTTTMNHKTLRAFAVGILFGTVINALVFGIGSALQVAGGIGCLTALVYLGFHGTPGQE